jgi:hypothetical protein
MKFTAGQTPIHQLDTADLDDAMLLFDLQTRGLGIQYDLAHQRLPRRQHAVDRNVGQLIDVFIACMSGMPLHPYPFDVLHRRGRIQ